MVTISHLKVRSYPWQKLTSVKNVFVCNYFMLYRQWFSTGGLRPSGGPRTTFNGPLILSKWQNDLVILQKCRIFRQNRIIINQICWFQLKQNHKRFLIVFGGPRKFSFFKWSWVSKLFTLNTTALLVYVTALFSVYFSIKRHVLPVEWKIFNLRYWHYIVRFNRTLETIG